MTPADLLAGLAPARLPLDMAAIGWREGAVLLALGLLAGWALAAVIRPLTDVAPSMRARIRATRGLAPQDRILAVARLLGRMPPPLRDAAYGAAPAPDDAAIERAARDVRPRRRGWRGR